MTSMIRTLLLGVTIAILVFPACVAAGVVLLGLLILLPFRLADPNDPSVGDGVAWFMILGLPFWAPALLVLAGWITILVCNAILRRVGPARGGFRSVIRRLAAPGASCKAWRRCST